MSFYELLEALRTAIRALFVPDPEANRWVWVVDATTDGSVVFELDGDGWDLEAGLYRLGYTVNDSGAITLADEAPEKVKKVSQYVTETVHLTGRALEARGKTADGHRIFRMQLIEAGRSLNGNHYPIETLHNAAALYEGAKAFDHHRTEAEYSTGTIKGLVGYWRNVEANDTGLEGDLVVLPSSPQVAEALDLTLEAQEAGLPPVIGVSHDVIVKFRPVNHEGRVEREATDITRVLSSDVVAEPAAGGRAIRMVAGGTGGPVPKEDGMNLQQLLALLREADPAKRAELLAEHATVVTESGLTEADVSRLIETVTAPAAPTAPTSTQETAPVQTQETAPPTFASTSILGRTLLAGATEKLSERGKGMVAKMVGAEWTEARLVEVVEMVEGLDFPDPVAPVQVTGDELDKRIERLDQSLAGNFRAGYRSLKEAYLDISGRRAPADMFGEDFNRQILGESAMAGLGVPSGMRESVTTSTWGEILGDSITRRLLKMYATDDRVQQALAIVSETPLRDFRTQRRVRMGGYGSLPIVNQGAPYQDLSAPTDEEATYVPAKRGGTEDLTIETIMADDLGAVARIPRELNDAAAETLYEFVFDILVVNAAVYDSVALFHATHANTSAAAALASATLTAGRVAMMKQTKYGTTKKLGATNAPRYLIVPPDLVETGFKLTRSAVAVTSGEDATTPNMHVDLELMVVAYLADTNDWFLAADPSRIDGIELGWVFGPDPQLFIQDDPKVGSVFTADKVTYKIRHGYGAGVVDYRPFYRGQG